MKMLNRILTGLALTASTVLAYADEAATLTSTLQAAMDKYCAAILKKDFKTADKIILAHFASDCKFTSQGQTLDLKGWMSMNNQQLKAMTKISKLTMKLQKFKITGNKAVGLENFAMVCTIPTGQDKKTAVLSVTSTNTTTMTKRNGKWLCTMVSSKPGKITIDGKPLNVSGGKPKKN